MNKAFSIIYEAASSASFLLQFFYMNCFFLKLNFSYFRLMKTTLMTYPISDVLVKWATVSPAWSNRPNPVYITQMSVAPQVDWVSCLFHPLSTMVRTILWPRAMPPRFSVIIADEAQWCVLSQVIQTARTKL